MQEAQLMARLDFTEIVKGHFLNKERKMTHSSHRFVFGIVAKMIAFCLVIAACNVPLPSIATEAPNTAITPVLPTLLGPATQPTLTTTETSSPSPSLTPSVTITSTNTPQSLPTTAIPNVTSVAPSPVSVCNKAQFVRDVTVPDGTIYSPSVTFTKTWRLKNIGTCTWTSSYTLVFDHGQKMGPGGSQPDPVALTTVAPGQTVDASISLTTPSLPGNYQADFRLRSNTGSLFGIGPSGQGTIWVKITVLPATSYP